MTTTVPRPTRPHASLRDRALRLAELVTTPLLPADYLDLVDPLRSGADLRGRIEAVHPETRDAATVVIRPGRGWRGHVPGQYVRIGVDVDGVRQWRAYSLTSPPDRADGCITITVKAIPDGKVSNHLVRRARPGTLVQLDQAAGDFVLPRAAPGQGRCSSPPAAASRPVMGMLRNAPDELTDVVAGALRAHRGRRRSSAPSCARWPPTAGSGWSSGTPTPTACSTSPRSPSSCPTCAERETWACGPTGLLDAARGALGRRRRRRPAAHRAVPPDASLVTGEGGTVTFSAAPARPSRPTAPRRSSTPARRPACSCRPAAGWASASAASLPLREGAVRDLRTGEITTAAPGDGVLIQTCVSRRGRRLRHRPLTDEEPP